LPHCILEYSANLPDAPDLVALLSRVHDALVESGEFSRDLIKSRAYEARDFCVTDGDPERGFVAMAIHVLEGRDDATLASLAERVLSILCEAYPASVELGKVELSVRSVEFERASYRKLAMTGR
jgi:5-carboxymethyl-2-hydroxymuconate isomerase